MDVQKWFNRARMKKAYDLYTDQEMPIYAGYATLFIMMAAVPMLMLVIAVINVMPWFSPEGFTETLFQFLPDLPEVKAMILGVVSNLNRQSSGLLVSITAITTLWSASAGMTAIQKGLQKITAGSVVTKADKPKALGYTFLFIFVILALLVFGVLGETIQKALKEFAKDYGFDMITRWITSVMTVSELLTLVGVVLVIALMYRYLPGGTRTMKDQIPGAIFSTVLWLVFSAIFAFFISRFWGASAIYGSLAAIFLIALWLRFIITILFLGAAFNQVLDEQGSEVK